jgi:hypothetical protein
MLPNVDAMCSANLKYRKMTAKEHSEDLEKRRKEALALHIASVSGSALDVVKQIPQVSQTQMSLNDQLKILRIAANKLGLYDAADFIKLD